MAKAAAHPTGLRGSGLHCMIVQRGVPSILSQLHNSELCKARPSGLQVVRVVRIPGAMRPARYLL